MACQKEGYQQMEQASSRDIFQKDDESWWDKLMNAVTIEVDVRFGHNDVRQNPNGEWVYFECISWGVCEISVSGNNSGSSDDYFPAQLGIVENEILLGMNKNEIGQENYDVSLADGVLEFGETITLPDEICSALSLTNGTEILAGDYAVIFEDIDRVVIQL